MVKPIDSDVKLRHCNEALNRLAKDMGLGPDVDDWPENIGRIRGILRVVRDCPTLINLKDKWRNV